MRLAVIPARGGSKRIPRKNIRNFYGKPVIAWSIEAARKSACFDCIVVSTDDQEIAEIAKKYGAEVPFIRIPELSDDYVGTTPVVAHTLKWLIEKGENFEFACCLYATAPFVCGEDIKRGFELIKNTDADYTFSVTSYPSPIQRAIRINQQQRVEMFQPEYYNTRSQDLENAWHDAGQFYWGKTNAWLSLKPIFSSNSVVIKLPRYQVYDIDTPEDWCQAELMFKAIQGKIIQ